MAKRTKVGIGLNVGSRSVQLAVLRSKKHGVMVEHAGTKELPHDAVVEGVVMDAQAVCEKITELLKENRVLGKDTAVAIGGRRVMLKRITTEDMSDDELAATIAYEAKNNLPFDVNDVSMDYAKLPQDADSDYMDLLLVAAKNEAVFDAVETLRWAGGKPVILEAAPIALQAALAEAGYFDDQTSVAALQIGFHSTDVSLFQLGQFESNRSLSVGGKTYIDGLIRELGISFERASRLVMSAQRTPEEQAALDRVAQQVSEKLAESVERSFPEYFGSGTEVSVSRLVLCGGGAHLPLLVPALRQRFGVEVEIADPFRRFVFNEQNIQPEVREFASGYAAAVGLALRAMGDRHPGFNLMFKNDRPEHKKTTYAGLNTVLPVVGGSVILFGIIMMHLTQEGRLAVLQNQLSTVRKETDLYRDKIQLVEELTAKRADVAARIDVISELDRNRFARVRVMDLLNRTLPQLTWITDVQEVGSARGPAVNVSGMTSSNLKVSQFMTALLADPLVRGVDLMVSEQTAIGETNVTRFTLQIALPGLGLSGVAPGKPVDRLKLGAQAIREQRAAQEQMARESKK